MMKGAHFLEPEGYSPYEFASAEKELNAARETAWIGVYLMMCARTDVSGPDIRNHGRKFGMVQKREFWGLFRIFIDVKLLYSNYKRRSSQDV